jgi:hypothetical protein
MIRAVENQSYRDAFVMAGVITVKTGIQVNDD